MRAQRRVVGVVGREVALHHLRGGNIRRQNVRVALVLQPLLVAAPEQQVLVRPWNRAAKAAARIVVALRSKLRARILLRPAVGVQHVIARVEVAFAVIVRAAANG